VPPCSNKICKLCDTANAAVDVGANVVAAAGNREPFVQKPGLYGVDDPG
jgi:hypothetical protein